MRSIVLVALLSPLVAAAADAAEVGLALKGGVQRSWAAVSGPRPFDTDAGDRLAIGLAVPVRLRDRLSFDPEILYAQVAFSSRDFDPVARITSRSFLLALPLKRHWNTEGTVSPHVAAGPQVVFIGRTRQRLGGLERDISDDVRDLDLGLLVGVGLGIKAGRGHATLEVRHAIGLRNLDETENDIKIRGLQLLVGYRF